MRSERLMQWSFAALHTYAAVLAGVALVLHIAAASYHLRRTRRARD